MRIEYWRPIQGTSWAWTPPKFSDVAAAIRLGVGVDDLAPESILGTPFNHFLVLTAEAFEVSLVIFAEKKAMWSRCSNFKRFEQSAS